MGKRVSGIDTNVDVDGNDHDEVCNDDDVDGNDHDVDGTVLG